MNTQPLQILGRFTFDLQGFCATYAYKGETTSLTLCLAALCDLLKETKLIEDFTLDRNSEPVILYTDNKFPPGYGFEYWSAFVKFFPISYRMGVKLLEWREERRKHREFQAIIVSLLSPLAA